MPTGATRKPSRLEHSCAWTLNSRQFHRNLGLAYYNKLGEPQLALQSLETAVSLNPGDARVLFELDQLYSKLNRSAEERLGFLEQHEALVASREDLTIERITLLNRLHRPHEALDILKNQTFHPWEGGEGKVIRQYAAESGGDSTGMLQEGGI